MISPHEISTHPQHFKHHLAGSQPGMDGYAIGSSWASMAAGAFSHLPHPGLRALTNDAKAVPDRPQHVPAVQLPTGIRQRQRRLDVARQSTDGNAVPEAAFQGRGLRKQDCLVPRVDEPAAQGDIGPGVAFAAVGYDCETQSFSQTETVSVAGNTASGGLVNGCVGRDIYL